MHSYALDSVWPAKWLSPPLRFCKAAAFVVDLSKQRTPVYPKVPAFLVIQIAVNFFYVWQWKRPCLVEERLDGHFQWWDVLAQWSFGGRNRFSFFPTWVSHLADCVAFEAINSILETSPCYDSRVWYRGYYGLLLGPLPTFTFKKWQLLDWSWFQFGFSKDQFFPQRFG